MLTITGYKNNELMIVTADLTENGVQWAVNGEVGYFESTFEMLIEDPDVFAGTYVPEKYSYFNIWQKLLKWFDRVDNVACSEELEAPWEEGVVY